MALWRVEKEWRYEGPGERGADTDVGYGFRLKHRETGAKREFSIEIAAGGSGVPGSRVREVLGKYLNEPNPPRRVKLDRDGNETA